MNELVSFLAFLLTVTSSSCSWFSSGGPSLTRGAKQYSDGLVMLDGVKTGHVQYIHDGTTERKVITRAMKPPIFEIPDFLTDEEVDNIVRRAKDPKEGGLFESIAKGGLTKLEEFKPSGNSGKAKTIYGRFAKWDYNQDDKISLQEMLSFFHINRLIYMKEGDLFEMFRQLNITDFDDEFITKEEFENLNTIGIEEYVTMLYNKVPRFKERHSEQTWLFMDATIDPMMHQIREKVVKISGLPREIVYGGEMLQVLRYGRDGHYNAHYDSETHDKQHIPCCHQVAGEESPVNEYEKCKLCRFATFLLYLNDVEEGGETGFPVADNATYLIDNMRIMGEATTDKFNLIENCKKGNLLVAPKKGTAILFYNHKINSTNNWLGEQDMYSLHGGCSVIKGEKWLANMWLTAPYSWTADTPSIYLNRHDFEIAENKYNKIDEEYHNNLMKSKQNAGIKAEL